MRIRTYSVDQDTSEETFEGECDLDEALDPEDPEYGEAQAELRRSGRLWCGGGATTLLLVMLVRS